MTFLLTRHKVSHPTRYRRLPQLPSKPVRHSHIPWHQLNQQLLKKRPTVLSEDSPQPTSHLQSEHTGLGQSSRRTCGLLDLLLAMDLPAWNSIHNNESIPPSRRRLLPELSMMTMMSTPLKRRWMRVPLMTMSLIGILSARACPLATNSEICSSVLKS